MANGFDIPDIAEAKPATRPRLLPSHQVLALKNEIIEYAKEHISFSEQIAEQKETIDALTEDLRHTRREASLMSRELLSAQKTIADLEYLVSLQEKVVKNMKDDLEHHEKTIEMLNDIIRNRK